MLVSGVQIILSLNHFHLLVHRKKVQLATCSVPPFVQPNLQQQYKAKTMVTEKQM